MDEEEVIRNCSHVAGCEETTRCFRERQTTTRTLPVMVRPSASHSQLVYEERKISRRRPKLVRSYATMIPDSVLHDHLHMESSFSEKEEEEYAKNIGSPKNKNIASPKNDHKARPTISDSQVGTTESSLDTQSNKDDEEDMSNVSILKKVMNEKREQMEISDLKKMILYKYSNNLDNKNLLLSLFKIYNKDSMPGTLPEELTG